MNCSFPEPVRVIAISPTSGGFGFVVFEGPKTLIDWGLKTTRHQTNVRCVALVANLLTHYRPDVVVIEDIKITSPVLWRWRRGRRVTDLLRRIDALSVRMNVECRRVSRVTVKTVFQRQGLTTKHQIAASFVINMPELGVLLPKPRKPWTSEDRRMSIFDAAALALAFFHYKTQPPDPADL